MNNTVNNNSKKVIKAGAGYVVGNYLLKGITFLSAPLFTRLLEPAEYGDYNTFLSYEGILYIIIGIALHSSLNSAKYKFAEKLDDYVSSIISLVISNTLLWFVLANVFFPLYSELLDLDRVQANVLVFYCFSSALFQIYNTYVSLSYSYKNYLVITSVNAIANIVLSLVLIITIFDKSRTMGRILGTVIPMGLIGFYIISYFFKKASPKLEMKFWGFGVKYSLPIVPHGISQVILASFDRIMIKKMVGSAEAGIYSFAFTIYSLFHVATNSLENVWKPWVFEHMNAKDYDSIKKRGSEYALGLAVFASLIILASPELIKILGDREYWGATPCVVPAIIGGFFAFLYTLPSSIEYFYEKTKYIAIGTMGAATLNIILNYLCIKKWGYVAAAYTTLVTYLLYFAFHYFLAWKVHKGMLFNSSVLILISVGLVAVGAVALVLEPYWYFRWAIALILFVVSGQFIEKKYGLISQTINTLKNRSKRH